MSKLCNSLAMQRMKEKDEMTQMDRVNTKQKRGTPTRDINLQSKVLHWIMDFIEEKPKRNVDYDNWISDGNVLSKVLRNVVFNSIPNDSGPTTNLVTKKERVDILLKYLRKVGVPEEYLFSPSDLMDMKNIPKVTRCIAMLAKKAHAPEFENIMVEIPPDEDVWMDYDSEDN